VDGLRLCNLHRRGATDETAHRTKTAAAGALARGLLLWLDQEVAMQTRLRIQGARLLFPALLIFAAPFAGVATDSQAEGGDFLNLSEAELPTLGGSPVQLMLIRGLVEPIEKDLFGRPERVAITFVNSHGVLIQNPVEDVAAGEDLKEHVGEDVTVRGALLVKADGKPALLIDRFEVNGASGEGSLH
jgi:hypothetical protein